MGYFDYPLDTKLLIRKKHAIKKELLQVNRQWIDKKVAILGGSTTNEVVDQLELALLNYGIKPVFYQSEYGQYKEDALFGNSRLDAFSPDIVYIHTNWRNVTSFPDFKDTKEEVDALLNKELENLVSIWDSVKSRYACTIIQNNFERPNYRLMGNRDIWDYHGRNNFISRLNQKIYEYVQASNSIYINDLDFIAQNYGLTNWNNSLYWNMYKYICPIDAIPYLAKSISDIIKSIYGRNKKILALDLDNTLWGGIVGDDGVDGIKLGPEIPQGRVYHDFQKYCKQLRMMGVLLAVDSKNDRQNAIAGLNHPNSILKEGDFVSIKANWEPKDLNLSEIAKDLSLGLDSFVFADDNPAEQDIIKKQMPEVAVPPLDKPENYIQIIDQMGYFEVTSFSEEDINKTEQYKARESANLSQSAFENYDDYLKSLDMYAAISEFEPITIQRVAQLTNKTNQFNLTTLRCSEDDIRAMQENPNFICLCGKLIDKFADNGIVTVIAGELIKNELHIRIWLMSCRVLKRGFEDFMMNQIVSIASKRGIDTIVGYYYQTQKNSMVAEFYKDRGFKLLKKENDNTIWTLQINSYKELKTQINEKK